MIPETNRLRLVLQIWRDERDLTLTVEGDKIKTSRRLADDERELILMHRAALMEIIPTMTSMCQAECQPHLRAWWDDRKKRPHRRAVDSRR